MRLTRCPLTNYCDGILEETGCDPVEAHRREAERILLALVQGKDRAQRLTPPLEGRRPHALLVAVEPAADKRAEQLGRLIVERPKREPSLKLSLYLLGRDR